MRTYSYGQTPPEVIEAALNQQCPNGYPMELVGEDREALTRVVNKGIDAHLEAVTSSEFNAAERKLADGRVITRYLNCNVSTPDMLVILRRLAEDDGDDAMSLRTGILSTLDIEEL
jgi:hypothetical protein